MPDAPAAASRRPRLAALRAALAHAGMGGFLLPVTDPWQGEYSPEGQRRAAWLTGFEGSAGLAAILPERAALFVDGRYTLQAAAEVDPADYAVFNSQGTTPEAWLSESLAAGARLGYDPWLHTLRQVERLEKHLEPRGIVLVPLTPNPVDALWGNRPPEPLAPVWLHPDVLAGETRREKLARVAGELHKRDLDACLLTRPDSICWLLNMRGGDIPYNPLALCFAVLERGGGLRLFIRPEKLGSDVREALCAVAQCQPPEALDTYLAALGVAGARVGYDPEGSAVYFYRRLEAAGAGVVLLEDPCLAPKARKNPVEIEGMRLAHVLDGAAVTRLLCWFDQLPPEAGVTELDVARELDRCRAQCPDYLGPSFAMIAGGGANGAVVHYHATEASNRAIASGDALLLDSGGQYAFGTTDITRTVARGEPPPDFKASFTRVLKGHIALARAVFPEGTRGGQLDALARQYLWRAGQDYDHGTGHGVGAYLCVHEGPQRISKRGGDAALAPGMILSNEPGYYREGAYGIRIESLALVVEHGAYEGTKFLGFETLTLAPIDTRLVETAWLDEGERAWLNAYHARVAETLSPHLKSRERAWLEARCRAV